MHKIRISHAYLLILFTFFLQLPLTDFLNAGAARPNFMIIVTIFLALFTNEKFGLKTGLVSGLLLDIFTLRLFGLHTMLFAFSGYIIGKYNNKFYRESFVTHIIITFFTSAFILSSYLLFTVLQNRPLLSHLNLYAIFGSGVMLSSLYNSLLGVLVYAFLCKIFHLSESAV